MMYKVRLPYIVYCDLSFKLEFLTIFQSHTAVGQAEGKIVFQHLSSILPAFHYSCLITATSHAKQQALPAQDLVTGGLRQGLVG